MPFDQRLAERIRELLPRATEKRMFGGMGLLERGHMVAGISKNDLVVRVPPEETSRWLQERGAHPMADDRPMKGWVKVSADAVKDDASLSKWVERSRAFTQTLPPK